MVERFAVNEDVLGSSPSGGADLNNIVIPELMVAETPDGYCFLS